MFSPSIKILVVDDMLTMRKMVMKNLTAMGFSEFMEAAESEKSQLLDAFKGRLTKTW